MAIRTTFAGISFSLAALSSTSCLTAAYAQERTIQLERIEIEADGETAKGPDDGIVAETSETSSKTATPLIETPQAVNVVTRDQMEKQAAKSVSDALRYTPGVLSEPNGYDIRYDWLYIRGFNALGTMWLDGLMLPGDPLGYAVPSINPFALERVEVMKGPASVLYGRSLPGGLVNQVSKRPQPETHREISVETTGFGGIQGALDMTGKLSEDGQLLGRFVGLAKNLNTQIDHEKDRQIMLAPSLTWAPTDDTSLTVYGYYQKDDPIFSPRFYPARGTLLPNPYGQIPRDVFLGDPDWGSFTREFYALGYEFDHSFNETWTVRQNLRYAAADQHMDLVLVNPAFAYPFPGTPNGSTLDRATAISDDQLSALTVDTQAEAKFDTGAFEHTALFGIDYNNTRSGRVFGNHTVGVAPIDYLDPVYGLDFPIATPSLSVLQKSRQLGFYAQDQIRYDRWLGTFGLRYDMSEIDSLDRMKGATVTTTDNALSGRAGLTYLFDNGIAPYVSYSTSFLPTLGTDRSGQPFQAQKARQFEVGVKYEPSAARGMVSASYFDLLIENALTPDPVDPLCCSIQTGEQRVRGIEIEAKYEVTPSLDVIAAYAYSNSKVTRSNRPAELGQEMLRLPEHQGALWANYRPGFADGLSLSAGVRATSPYQTDVTYNPLLRIPSRVLVDVGAEFDFGALKKEFEGTTLRVNVTNLFDKTYVTHCINYTGGSCNYGTGRTITANLSYRW
ncbi:MAG TPA: TonB-dependent siderophore receptor [Rhizobiaceae bacterium]|nr:TonB-dependent siderophore receptor [Rhizobiaceae bacterium]